MRSVVKIYGLFRSGYLGEISVKIMLSLLIAISQ